MIGDTSKAEHNKVPMSLCESQPFIGDMYHSARHPLCYFGSFIITWKINQCLLSHLKGLKEVMRSLLSLPVKQGNVGNEILAN